MLQMKLITKNTIMSKYSSWLNSSTKISKIKPNISNPVFSIANNLPQTFFSHQTETFLNIT